MKKIFVLMLLIGISIAAYSNASGPSVTGYAGHVVKRCANTSYRPACYEKEIPKLMSRISMEDAFAVTKIVQDKDPQFVYCHVVAHKLTEIETAKNPDTWKDVLLRCPMAMCNYGCLHGSLIARFRSEELTDEEIEQTLPELADLCEPRVGFAPTEIEKTMCYHGVGHLAMYMTSGNPGKAIPVCEQLASGYIKTCVEGIFMTVFQSIDPEDRALVAGIKPKREDVARFCSQFENYIMHCRRESFFLFLHDAEDPKNLSRLCAYAQGEDAKKDCVWAFVNVMTDKAFEHTDGVQRMDAYCRGVPWCHAGAAMRLVQVDPIRNVDAAGKICQKAGADCYENLLYYARISFLDKNDQYRTYCQALPVFWREQCLAQ